MAKRQVSAVPSRPQPGLVLASGSRYRRALLERLPLRFTWVSPDVDETPVPGEAPAVLVARLALAKARAVVAGHPDSIIIGSDQVAVLDERIVGKPMSHAAAGRQLAECSGRSVQFLTAAVALGPRGTPCLTHTDVTTVHFRQLDAAEIDRYLRLDTPYDCAGGFKAEAAGIALFRRIDSRDPTALTGLPLIWVCGALAELGLALI